ncbi:hypothetical protein KI387_019803, partial [Taxus chinensis]
DEWDKWTRNARTGRFSENQHKEPKSNWDKRAENTRTGRTGRNCPKRSKIKIGRPGQKDPKTRASRRSRKNQKVPRVVPKGPKIPNRGFCPKSRDKSGRMDAKYAEDPAGPRTIEKLPRVIKEKPK